MGRLESDIEQGGAWLDRVRRGRPGQATAVLEGMTAPGVRSR